MGRACGLSLVAVLALLALLVLGSGEARAASASVSVVEGYRGEDDDIVVIVASEPAERNDMTVLRERGSVLVRDTGALVRPGRGCVAEDAHAVPFPPARRTRMID
jgi:hypothetical protein